MFSRAVPLIRTAKLLRGNGNASVQSLRKSHDWYYRTGSKIQPKYELASDVLMGIMWWWVLWHLVTEPGHITGEFPYPEPEKWTNAELGIPDN